mgnify:CR=1 FL=1
MRSSGSITDVAGILVGHHARRSRGWRTGTTVIRPVDGAVCGVDVRGGGPGTRETDALRPENLIQKIHAICLTGGSAFGLAAADGVMSALGEMRVGFPVGADDSWRVPIVPAAVIFDLGRGGKFDHRPDADFGRRALAATRKITGEGSIGAGTGARAGGLQGGVGTCSMRVGEFTVAAFAVVNAVGDVIDPDSALPWESPFDRGHLRRPDAFDRRRLREHLSGSRPTWAPPLNTTIGVIATDAPLTKSECTKMAAVAHDGIARAVRPSHLLTDGDTIFGLSLPTTHAAMVTSEGSLADGAPARMNPLLAAAAEVFARACSRAVTCADSLGGPPAYRDLCPSAFR